MASPTAQVQSASIPFTEDTSLYPLIGGATVATTYYTGEMMGLRSDGYATRFDDSAAMKYLGILDGPRIQVTSDDASGARLASIRDPRFLEMDLDTGTTTRAGDIGKPVYAATVANGGSGKVSYSPGTYGNLVGWVEDVVSADPKTIGSATRVLIRPAGPQASTTVLPLALTAAQTLTAGYANRPLLWNSATGAPLVLPAATGTGNTFSFRIGTSVTSGSLTFSDGSAHLYGQHLATTDGSSAQPATTSFAVSAATTITLNGTTKGGLIGDEIVFVDLATNKYAVQMRTRTTGTAATSAS